MWIQKYPSLTAQSYFTQLQKNLFKVSGYFMCSFEIGRRFTDGMSLAVAKLNGGTQVMRGAHVLAQIQGMMCVIVVQSQTARLHQGRTGPR
jgi:hypothetical protein